MSLPAKGCVGRSLPLTRSLARRALRRLLRKNLCLPWGLTDGGVGVGDIAGDWLSFTRAEWAAPEMAEEAEVVRQWSQREALMAKDP